MPSITNFSLSLHKSNDSGTFSEGDTVSGEVFLELIKSTKIWSLCVKAQGDANTEWTEEGTDEDGNTHKYTRGTHKRLFKTKEFLISTKVKETSLAPGRHSFPFNIRIPSQYMPSSFSGAYGSIVYTLEAKLCRRNKKKKRTVQKTFEFRSKSVPNCVQMCPLMVSTTEGDIGSYVSGTVQMEVRVEKNAFSPGETLTIATKVINRSNNIMKPRFVLSRLVFYREENSSTAGSRVVTTQSGSIVRPQSEKEFTNILVFPHGTTQTVHDCAIISLEYRLDVQLEVLYSDKVPKVQLPLVVIAADTCSGANFKPMESTGGADDLNRVGEITL